MEAHQQVSDDQPKAESDFRSEVPGKAKSENPYLLFWVFLINYKVMDPGSGSGMT
jgi:hypothetical protein